MACKLRIEYPGALYHGKNAVRPKAGMDEEVKKS